jgi:hypothetical protein
MRLPHHSKIDGSIVGATRSASGHPQCSSGEERDKNAADDQARARGNPRLGELQVELRPGHGSPHLDAW